MNERTVEQSAGAAAPVEDKAEITELPALDVTAIKENCKYCLVRKDLWDNSNCWHGTHEIEDATLVPFSKADACWCQPFDGPIHPECPMHGDKQAPRPELDILRDAYSALKASDSATFSHLMDVKSELREKDAEIARLTDGWCACIAKYSDAIYLKDRAEKAEAELATLRSQRDEAFNEGIEAAASDIQPEGEPYTDVVEAIRSNIRHLKRPIPTEGGTR